MNKSGNSTSYASLNLRQSDEAQLACNKNKRKL
jgi:hypothetical protein